MRDFAALYTALDESNKTNAKVAAMAAYFATATAEDSAWAIFFLTGRRVKNLVKRATLRSAILAEAQIPDWLYQECYDAVGDSAETISLLLPTFYGIPEHRNLAEVVEQEILSLGSLTPEEQEAKLRGIWRSLSRSEVFVFTKLITGALRVGVSQDLVVRALSQAYGVPVGHLSHRLMGNWEPKADLISLLRTQEEEPTLALSQPYPFCLAHALPDPTTLGEPQDWAVEWKWDGIRAQVIRRQGESFVWSRGEELLNETFPDIVELVDLLPDGTVIDGEILAYREGVLPFNELQRRLGRKKPGKKILTDVPTQFVAFDLLEWQGADLRQTPLSDRQTTLRVALPEHPRLTQNQALTATTLEEIAAWREEARGVKAEGLMLKRWDSSYEGGRKTGLWWKWKVTPITLDCVLIYAQRGTGRRANLYTDYTFGVWNPAGELVPLCKAYSGLNDEEIRQVDAFVRRHTLEKFGPVRTVTPELVFEIAFEGIQLSSRHKSGVAIRFPRIQRWRRDKKPGDADRLDTVHELLLAREAQ